MSEYVPNHSVFSEETVRRIIEENQKSSQEERTGPNIAFLPEGRHIIRWFFDPFGKLFREVMIGRVGKKRFVCPDFLARTDKVTPYPVCRLDELSKEHDLWKDKCRYHCISYGYLYETKNASEYWVINKPYAIIGNSFLKRGLLTMLENLQDNGMDMLLAMLTPTASGFFSSVTVKRGQQGDVSIQVLPNPVKPIELDAWYLPLSEVYIQNEFDEKMYYDAISEYERHLTPGSGGGPGGTEGILDGWDDDPAQETVNVSHVNPVVTPLESENSIVTLLDDAAVDLSPRVARTTTKRTTRKKLDLPEHILQEMLPEGCPGWGNYTHDLTACALCDYNVECMSAGDVKS